MRLNQLLAIEKDARDRGMKVLTEAYHDGQRAQLLDGFQRTYTRDDDDGELFPSESKVLQVRMRQVLRAARVEIAKMLDLAAKRDEANCEAKADVVVDDKVVLAQVPATYLLVLEKRLIDLRTFIGKMPVLPPADAWSWDANADCYKSATVETAKTKKVPKVLVKYEATKEHPAQTELIYEDRKVGTWSMVKFSGALPRSEVQGCHERVNQLIEAVKVAQQKANSVEVPKTQPYGETVLGFIFG
ncbi:MAG: hypothetical protein R3337_00230 [Gammaproteobacteria bacterium]|nr:hypothetical protein [Gammaproteobacteria bacterium]